MRVKACAVAGLRYAVGMRRPALLALLALAACGKTPGPAPHQIHIVGSSAAFPFSSIAAERLMREDATAIAPLVFAMMTRCWRNTTRQFRRQTAQ